MASPIQALAPRAPLAPLVPLVPLVALALAGCGEPPWPEVSVANCQPAKTMRIRDRDRRAEFVEFCQTIPVAAMPIQPEIWLALSDEALADLERRGPLAPRLAPTPQPLNWLSLKP